MERGEVLRSVVVSVIGVCASTWSGPTAVFTLDGQSFDVENNIWLVGNDEEVLVIDAAHDAGPIIEGIDDRRVVAIVCTHGHNDHINAALDLHGFVGQVPIALHDDDRMLWSQLYAARGPDMPLRTGRPSKSAAPRSRSSTRRATRPEASASTSSPKASCSPATRCSKAGPEPPAGRTRTFRRSSTPSGRNCSRCRPKPSSTPGTAIPPPSARKPRTSTNGLPGVTEGSSRHTAHRSSLNTA